MEVDYCGSSLLRMRVRKEDARQLLILKRAAFSSNKKLSLVYILVIYVIKSRRRLFLFPVDTLGVFHEMYCLIYSFA